MQSNTEVVPETAVQLRTLSQPEAYAHAKVLEPLAARFEACANALLATSTPRAAITSVRSAMQQAGKALCDMVAPQVGGLGSTPWLFLARQDVDTAAVATLRAPAWSLPERQRTQVDVSLGAASTPWTIGDLVMILASERGDLTAVPKANDGHLIASAFLEEHVFLEAIVGWLGQQCRPHLDLIVPRLDGELRLGSAPQAERIAAVVDRYPIDAPEAASSFVRIASAGAVACRHLATIIEARILEPGEFRALQGPQPDSPTPQNRGNSGPSLAPREIDNHVERAFDLLMHYRDALKDVPGNFEKREASSALGKLEDVLQHWLPRAADAREPLIAAVLKVIGRRDEAKRVLNAADLWAGRQACLQRLAEEAYARDPASANIVSRCRAEIHRWRSRQPLTKRIANGQLAFDAHAQLMARSVSAYWSVDLTSRPSRMGASLFLAAACDALAHAAQQRGLPREAILPAIHLPVRLRRDPDWARMDLPEAPRVLQEQLDLACGVEDLLAELAATPEPHQEDGMKRVQPSTHGVGTGATQPQSPRIECIVEKTGTDRALVQEGGTKVTIKGPRKVWLLLAVVNAQRGLTWNELVEGDISTAAEMLDRRVKSRSGSGTERPTRSLGNRRRGEETPRMATQAKSLQNLGSRTRKDLGKLAYHWHQDGEGVIWSPDCQ